MTPKSERFEMRLDEETQERIDAWRAKQDDLPSRAQAVRQLIEGGLNKDARNVKFSDGEKLITLMLADLFGHLKINGDIDAMFVASAIVGGHNWALKSAMPFAFSDHTDDPSDVSLVVNVLDMWTFLESGHAAASKKEKERIAAEVGVFGTTVRFSGFDGNYEGELMSIANFLVDDMGRFTKFKGRDLNSHAPTADRNRRMLKVFEPIRATLDGTGLSADQIISVLKAIHE